MFDTLSYSESLAKIGVPQEQAKLQAKVLSKVFESNDLATKFDITELRSDVKFDITGIKADIAELRSDVKTDFTELKAAVKSDITELKAAVKSDITGIKSDITELKAAVKTQMAEMELRIIKWQIGGIGLVIAAIKFL